MGTYREEKTASEQRSLDDLARQSTGSQEVFLLRRIRALEDELEAAREHARVQARERQAMEAGLALLRDANEHLVLATFNAEHLREDAEAANRRQNEFLAMLAHELRNPLSPISMAASLLLTMPNASPQMANLSRVIGRQVDHMARLLDDLLDAARISSGKITLSVQPLPLAELLQHAVETIQPRIQERRQHLTLALGPGADAAVVDGDRVRLTQVFTNLIGNASKYTGDGGTLRVTASVEEGAQSGDVLVVVEDNGIGMAPEVIPHIFDLFTQGPRSLARSEGGLGVGLNVVRNLLAMHGATVSADSAGLGQGSRFTVRLPRSSGTVGPQAPAPAPVRRTALNILLVEDNVDACDTLAGFLVSEGHQVRCAYDGHEGLAAALNGAWDVIICDVGLPGMDGLDLMRAVRAAVAEGGRAPFAVALSGYGQDDDRTRGLEAGFDHYLVKPVAAAGLRELIAQLEGSEPGVGFQGL